MSKKAANTKKAKRATGGPVHEKAASVQQEASGVQSEAGPVNEPAVKLKSPQVRLAALECATMAEAESRLGVEDLAGLLAGNQRLAQAWEKGRRLKGIRELAATPICMEEASKRLGMGEDGLVKLYKRDREVRDIWDQARLGAVVEMKKGLMARATSGNAHALDTVEKILAGEFAKAGRGKAAEIDFSRLTPTQMEEATGIKRQQFGRWAKDHGMPRNGDGRTYSMHAVVAWLRQFEVEKLSRTTGKAGVDPLREQKARKAKVDADLAENRVVPIEIAEQRLLERAHVVMRLLSADRAEEWASLHEGLTALQLKEMYQAAFEAVRVEMCRRLDVGVTLPAAVQAKLDEVFEMMKGQENGCK